MLVLSPGAARSGVAAAAGDVVVVLSGRGPLTLDPGELVVYPCDAVDVVSAVDAGIGGGDDGGIGFSPYVVACMGFLEVESPSAAVEVIRELRHRLVAGGWVPLEVVEDDERTGDLARLVVEAPEGGYGTRVAGVAIEGGACRVVVIVSSPCLRHPYEVESL